MNIYYLISNIWVETEFSHFMGLSIMDICEDLVVEIYLDQNSSDNRRGRTMALLPAYEVVT